MTWDELARHDAVLALQTDLASLRSEVGRLRPELVAEFRQQIVEQNRLLVSSTTGAIFTSASLAFAAVRF